MPDATAASRPIRSRRRLVWFAVFAVLLGVLAAVVGSEFLLRVYDPLQHPLADMRGFYRLDAAQRIETTPGWRGTHFVEGRRLAVAMNALGLRGAEVGPRQPGERRVLVLGDSFVWGMGVEDDQAFPAVLQRRCREAGLQVTVGNGGMFGTGPREWAYTLERHRATFAPDLVVAVLYVGNDVVDTLQAPLSVVDGWLLHSDAAVVARESWRFRLRVASRVWDKVERLLSGLDMLGIVRAQPIGPGMPLGEALFLDRDPARDAEEPFVAEALARLDACFAQFARAAAGLPTLVVLVPSYRLAQKDYATVVAELNGLVPEAHRLDATLLQRGRSHARMVRLLARHGLPVLDLGERILEAPDRKALFLPTDGHFSVEGNERIAAWLQPEVAARLQ